MEHTPYGYDIAGGKAVINEEQAAAIRRTCENYLSGMSLTDAAAAAGIARSHYGAKRLMLNRRYRGDGFYPAILTEEMADRVEAELQRRAEALGRDHLKAREVTAPVIYTAFTVPRIPQKYDDPIRQAEYAYSMIACKEEQ